MTARELIDRMVPEHDRTSCSDTDLANGYANDQGHFRCARCVLLEGLEGGLDDSTRFTVGVYNQTITDAVSRVHAAERDLENARRELRDAR